MKIQRRRIELTIPQIPMADIAFNLVLFFIILAKTQDDSYLKWEPATTAKVERIDEAKVSVAIDLDAKLYVNGMQVGIAQMAGEIEKLLGNLPAGKRTVLLKIHKDITAATFEPVIEAVNQAGGEMVHVLREEQRK